MLTLLGGVITVLFGFYLVSLLIITMIKKKSAINFFSSFASSAKAHFTEQILTLIAGAGLLLFSNRMLYEEFFKLLGGILIIKSVVLMIIPWQLHHKFGKWAIPFTVKNILLYSIVASILGIAIIYSSIAPVLVKIFN